jgi:hypothetical protein
MSSPQAFPAISFNGAYHSRTDLDAPAATLAPGSRNYVRTAAGKKPFRGIQAAAQGARALFQVRNTYGGLGDYVSGTTPAATATIGAASTTLTASGATFVIGDVGKYVMLAGAGVGGRRFIAQISAYTSTTVVTLATAATTAVAGVAFTFGTRITGVGSLFGWIGGSLWYAGDGQVLYDGTFIAGALASTTLKILLQRAGSYTAGDSGPYSAGLNQPSAPDVAVLAAPGGGFTGLIDGVVSFKIARVRTSTGARSVASVTSAVVQAKKQTIRITFPAAAAGQTHWVIFATQEGFGGVGNHYRLRISNALQVSETAVAAGTVDGVARSLELDFQTGDLDPETAWIDDYPPPACTHTAAIENVTLALGCYADATSDPTSSSTGTIGAVSLPNFPESFKPTHLLYFPASIVSVMGRAMTSYLMVGCENWVGAVTYAGGAGGQCACVLTTVLSDVGIAKPYNWCMAGGATFVYTAQGALARINGVDDLDDAFAAPIRADIEDWSPDDVRLFYNPDTVCLVVANPAVRRAYHYSLETNDWSPPVHLSDYTAGQVIAGIQTPSANGGDPGAYVTVEEAGTHTVSTWDAGTTSAWTTAMSQWQPSPGGDGRRSTIHDLPLTFKTQSTAANSVLVGIHRNLLRTHVTDAQIGAASSLLNSATAQFSADDIGKRVAVFGAGAGGGVHLALIIALNSPTQVQLDAAAWVAASNAYCLVAQKLYQLTPRRKNAQQFTPRKPNVRECYSYAVSVSILAAGGSDSQALGCTPYGTMQGGSRGTER